MCAETFSHEQLIELSKQASKHVCSRKNVAFNVTKLHVQNRVLDKLQGREDPESEAIRHRLNPVGDLVAEEAKYHFSCMKKLYLTDHVL